MTALAIVVAVIALMAGVLVWLQHANARDLQAMAERLHLSIVRGAPAESAPDPVLGRYRQWPVLRGTIDGFEATVWLRQVRRRPRADPTAKSHFTILSLRVPATDVRLRLEPARTGALAAAIGGEWDGFLTGDTDFDAAFRLNSPVPAAALALLDSTLRARLLALRATLAGPMPDTALGRFAADLLSGTLELDGERLSWIAMGTITGPTAAAFEQVAPCLAAIAAAVRRHAAARGAAA